MTIEEQSAFLAREYAEAIRYMDNAKEVLKKSKKSEGNYADVKYVRMACGTAYNGVLIAIDAWLVAKGVEEPPKPRKPAKGQPKSKTRPRKSIEYYTHNIAQLDKKLLTHLNSAYNILHLYGYYDGETTVKMIEGGFDKAYQIIDKIKPYK